MDIRSVERNLPPNISTDHDASSSSLVAMSALQEADLDLRWLLVLDFTQIDAQEIQRIVNRPGFSGLSIADTHDPAVRTLSAELFDGRHTESPILYEINGQTTRGITGLAINARLAAIFGASRSMALVEAIANNSSTGRSPSRRRVLAGLAATVAGGIFGLSRRTNAAADSPAACGVGFYSDPNNVSQTEYIVNCRACPFLNSTIITTVTGDVHTRGFTLDGDFVSETSLWFRTSGTIGCWCSGDALG